MTVEAARERPRLAPVVTPVLEGIEPVRRPEPCAFVIFGATGDLTRRRLLPALYALALRDLLPERLALVALARPEMRTEEWRRQMREAVSQFYEQHFRHYSRQIVLVDVLRALLAGRDAFDDTRLAIDAILDSFRYGHGGIISKLLFGSHIDRVLFAATKADHVPDIQRDHLAALLRNMAAFPALEVKGSNAQLDVMALASVISTAEDSQEIDGQLFARGSGPGGADSRAIWLGVSEPEDVGAREARVRVFTSTGLDDAASYACTVRRGGGGWTAEGCSLEAIG